MDVEAISKGEHPDFGALGKMGMIVRGYFEQKISRGAAVYHPRKQMAD